MFQHSYACLPLPLAHFCASAPFALLQEKLYGCKVELADRDFVENHADVILQAAAQSDVAVLVVGDPFAYVCVSPSLCRFSLSESVFPALIQIFFFCCSA